MHRVRALRAPFLCGGLRGGGLLGRRDSGVGPKLSGSRPRSTARIQPPRPGARGRWRAQAVWAAERARNTGRTVRPMEPVFAAFGKRLLLYAALYGAAVAIFMQGFFLSRVQVPGQSECASPPWPRGLAPEAAPGGGPGPGCWLEPQYRRAVVVVIDALRLDFAAPIRDPGQSAVPANQMPYVRDMLAHRGGNATALFAGVAEAPTVTTQRLQAVTTGALPTFADVASSFTASSLREDNWVDALNRTGKRCVGGPARALARASV